MCCKSEVTPLDGLIAETILTVGLFTPSGSRQWQRRITDGEDTTAVNVSLVDGKMEVWLTPAVNVYAAHAQKRVAASVYFEIMAAYAEKVGGTIVQKANVTGCTDGGVSMHTIAHYPEMPLLWENVCAGFKSVFLGEQL